MNQECSELLERWPLANNFDLPENSVVLVVGAYKGITMELLDELYHPKLIKGYEPQQWAANQASERFKERTNCYIIENGLWAAPENHYGVPMGEYFTDACSVVNTGEGSREQGTGNFVDANYALTLLRSKIDLMVMNIEGYEFELIPYLDKNGWFNYIDRLAIQFHLDLGNDQNYNQILDRLGEIYRFEVNELPAWGYWSKANA